MADGVEDTLAVAAVLAACGGFLDAFTYIGHNHVFANAMTGNVVLLGVNASNAQWGQARAHLYPILAFVAGVAMAQIFRLRPLLPRVPPATLAALGLEIVVLAGCGGFPRDFAGTALVLMISFVAALQNTIFRQVGQWTYNSTMTTGNLRVFAESLFGTIVRMGRAGAGAQARVFGLICCAFLVGAVIGGLCTMAWANRALWAVDVGLMALWVWLFVGRSGTWRRAPVRGPAPPVS